MARQGISQQQIIGAIKELETEGKDLTVTAIRDRLGTGSFSTISSVLAEWRKEQSRTTEKPIPDVPESVNHLVRHLWAEAWRSADGLYELERQGFLREQEQHATVKEELTAEIRRLEGELEEALTHEQSSREALEKCREEAKANQIKVQSELQAFRVELAKKVSALELLQEEVKRLRAENLKDRQELTGWVERATNAEARLNLAEKEKKPRK